MCEHTHTLVPSTQKCHFLEWLINRAQPILSAIQKRTQCFLIKSSKVTPTRETQVMKLNLAGQHKSTGKQGGLAAVVKRSWGHKREHKIWRSWKLFIVWVNSCWDRSLEQRKHIPWKQESLGKEYIYTRQAIIRNKGKYLRFVTFL